MRVLLVEDEMTFARSLELMLKSKSFKVHTTDLGEEGVDLGRLYDYDIILLDLNLPDMSGFDVVRKLRASKIATPVLILSGLAGVEEKVHGLRLGADDFLPKPFTKDELVARIYSLVRRSKGHAGSLIEIGDLTVNLSSKTAHIAGTLLHLTTKEYEMVELLALRMESVQTKEAFLNHLYDDEEPDAKIIDVFICKLRRKLALASQGNG